jgi:anti-anti-sigma factor
MNLKIEIKDNIAIIFLSANTVGGSDDSAKLQGIINLLLPFKQIEIIIVDLEEVRWINARGIGALMGAQSELAKLKIKYLISGTNESIANKFKMMKLDIVFKLFKTIALAKESLLKNE